MDAPQSVLERSPMPVYPCPLAQPSPAPAPAPRGMLRPASSNCSHLLRRDRRPVHPATERPSRACHFLASAFCWRRNCVSSSVARSAANSPTSFKDGCVFIGKGVVLLLDELAKGWRPPGLAMGAARGCYVKPSGKHEESRLARVAHNARACFQPNVMRSTRRSTTTNGIGLKKRCCIGLSRRTGASFASEWRDCA